MFKSKTAKAIEDFQNQIDKTKKSDFDFDTWKVGTASLVKFYLGEDSDEYKSLHAPSIRMYSGYNFDGEKKQYDNEDAKSICKLLQESIGSIQRRSYFEDFPNNATPVRKKKNTTNTKPEWYSSPLFKYIIWPLLVTVIGGILIIKLFS